MMFCHENTFVESILSTNYDLIVQKKILTNSSCMTSELTVWSGSILTDPGLKFKTEHIYYHFAYSET